MFVLKNLHRVDWEVRSNVAYRFYPTDLHQIVSVYSRSVTLKVMSRQRDHNVTRSSLNCTKRGLIA
jgi:hypothetical protein